MTEQGYRSTDPDQHHDLDSQLGRPNEQRTNEQHLRHHHLPHLPHILKLPSDLMYSILKRVTVSDISRLVRTCRTLLPYRSIIQRNLTIPIPLQYARSDEQTKNKIGLKTYKALRKVLQDPDQVTNIHELHIIPEGDRNKQAAQNDLVKTEAYHKIILRIKEMQDLRRLRIDIAAEPIDSRQTLGLHNLSQLEEVQVTPVLVPHVEHLHIESLTVVCRPFVTSDDSDDHLREIVSGLRDAGEHIFTVRNMPKLKRLYIRTACSIANRGQPMIDFDSLPALKHLVIIRDFTETGMETDLRISGTPKNLSSLALQGIPISSLRSLLTSNLRLLRLRYCDCDPRGLRLDHLHVLEIHSCTNVARFLSNSTFPNLKHYLETTWNSKHHESGYSHFLQGDVASCLLNLETFVLRVSRDQNRALPLGGVIDYVTKLSCSGLRRALLTGCFIETYYPQLPWLKVDIDTLPNIPNTEYFEALIATDTERQFIETRWAIARLRRLDSGLVRWDQGDQIVGRWIWGFNSGARNIPRISFMDRTRSL